MSVIGFDIGNLNCFIAVARAGGIETIANEHSDRCTPAYVSFNESQRFVGSAAKSQAVTNSKNTISNIKRFIGRQFDDPFVQREISNLPFAVVRCPDGSVGIKVQYLNKEEVFSSEQILAMLLSELKKSSEHCLGSKTQDCVISVPSFFTDYQRRALLNASQIAGLNCLRLLNETTAVALSYGLFKKDLPAPKENPRNVVFVDVGHSACQVSVCAFNKGKIKVLSTASDPMLGGRDFDYILREYFGAEFLSKYNLNAKSQVRPWIRLLTESERIKKLMSANATDLPLSIECFMNDKDVTTRINRSKMEELASDLLSRLEKTLQDAFNGSGLTKEEIHSVEAVGGSTRVPSVKNVIQTFFEKDLCFTLNADEAVAKGCAIQCAMLSPTFKVRDIDVVDATAYPIHMSWKTHQKDEEMGEMEIFSRNHSFPAIKMLTLKRKEPFELFAYYNQDSGIPHTEYNIGRFLIKDVVPTATGEAAKIKVRVKLNIHGIISVSSATMIEDLPTPPPAPEQESKQDNVEPMDTTGGTEPTNENGTDNSDSSENGKSNPPEPTTAPEQATTHEQTAAPTEGAKEETTENSQEKKDENQATDTKDAAPQPVQKKVKKQVKSTDLVVESFVPCVSPATLNSLIEKENEMIMQVKLEKERADAFNSVEEYVYDMRSKIYEQYDKYITEEDRDKFSSLLTATEDWLYDEGEGQPKNVYVEKLAELKKFGQPVVDRCKLHSEIPSTFDVLGQSIIHYGKIVNKYASKDEQYAHIEEAEMSKVAKRIEEKQKWLNEKMTEFHKTASYQTPNVLPSQILAEKASLESFCNPIVNKPKPKAEPPKEEKKDSKNGGNGGDGKESDKEQAKNDANETKTTETPSPDQSEKKDKDLDMEVD